jgi:two-component system, cell cycle response regulator
MARAFTDPEILVDRVTDLPALQAVVVAVMGLVDRGDTQADQLGEILAADAVLASRILRVVNSSFYSLPQQVTSISKAVVLLGFETIRKLVMASSVVSVMDESFAMDEDLRLLWERSFFAAVTARKIAHHLKHTTADESFMGGLLMDIGMLIHIKLHGEPYSNIVSRDLHAGESITVLEVEAFDVSHERLGHTLLLRWGLPDILTRTILYHHDLSGSEEESPMAQKVALSVHMAQLASAVFFSPDKRRALRAFRVEAKRLGKMGPDDVDFFFKPIRDEVVKMAELYGIQMQELPSYGEVLDEANQELDQLNKSYKELNQELEAARLRAENLARSLKLANDQLREIAHSDELTGLYNRRYFESFLEKELDRSQRYERPLSCIMVDIDHFKAVNDDYGHLQGDSVLKELAQRLGACLRSSDVAARFGGEEFIFILPETNLYAARITAEKLRRSVEQDAFSYRPSKCIPITISLGVATYDPGKGDQLVTVKELIAAADSNLYRAKDSGRNKTCF